MTGGVRPPRRRYQASVELVVAMVLGDLLMAGCSTRGTGLSDTPAAKAVEAGQPVQVVEALIRDKTTTEQGGQTSWTTTWRLCFAPDRAVTTRLEAQAVTTEGSGTSLRELDGECLELDIARGNGTADARKLGRVAQLAEAAALAYRVRAVHHDGTLTPWTEPIRVGATKR